MIRQPIESSNLVSVGYDPMSLRLEVEFKKGKKGQENVYSYARVPLDVYRGLIAAESPGAYFAENIKDQYETTKL